MNLKNTSGFTIIEIIAVLVTMGVIAAFVVGRAGMPPVWLSHDRQRGCVIGRLSVD